jgi:hypothetical protein
MNRFSQTNPKTCPGINRFVRPTMAYVKCHVCGGDVEIWSDENRATYAACGAEWRHPDKDASCLEYCEYADKCREIIKSFNRPSG